MGYGELLKNPGSKGRTPKGVSSWKQGINQTKGNLRWELNFLRPEEIVSLLSEVYFEDLEDHSTPEKRYHFLENLEEYHKEMIESISKERYRLIETFSDELLDIDSVKLEDKILNEIKLSNINREESLSQTISQNTSKNRSNSVNVFSELSDREKLFCPSCMSENKVSVEKFEEINRIKCRNCGSDMIPKEVLSESIKLLTTDEKRNQ